MKTIVELLENSAQKYGNNPYLLEKKTDRYELITYRETKEQAYKVAAGLMALGIKKGDRIALLSESRTDWVISELGNTACRSHKCTSVNLAQRGR